MARPYPRARAMGETVREIVARILVEDVSDPRLVGLTVTGVEMSSDLRHANVFFTTHDDPEAAEAALAGLQSAKGRIRALLGQEVQARYVPELHFRLDPAIEEASRIAEAIRLEREAARPTGDSEEDAPSDV